MILTLHRLDRFGDAIPGDIYEDGAHVCVTLENADHAIKAGRYPIAMTESARAKAGSLWSPREDHVLPLVCDVVGREGIRLHAANHPAQLEGCIAPGITRDGDAITNSRVALIALMAKIQAAPAPVWLDVVDP